MVQFVPKTTTFFLTSQSQSQRSLQYGCKIYVLSARPNSNRWVTVLFQCNTTKPNGVKLSVRRENV
jgi:hypothetical protein